MGRFTAKTTYGPDKVLSNLLVETKVGEFIAEQCMPIVPVGDRKFTYFKFEPIQELYNEGIKGFVKANGAEAKVADHEGYSEQVDKTILYGLKESWTEQDLEDYNVEARSLQEMIQRSVKRKLMLDMESRVRDIIFGSTYYNATLQSTLTGTSQWSNTASDPIKAIGNANELVYEKVGAEADTLVINKKVEKALIYHPLVRAQIGANTLVTPEQVRSNLAAILGLRQILVGTAQYNSAKEGQTATRSQVWGNNYAALVFNPADVSQREMLAHSAIFRYKNMETRTYEEERTPANWIEVNYEQVERQIVQDAGYLFIDAAV